MFVGGLSWETTQGIIYYSILKEFIIGKNDFFFNFADFFIYCAYYFRFLHFLSAAGAFKINTFNFFSEALQRHFSRYGDVVDCVVMKNTESGRSRGFGFVTFADPSNVGIVLQNGPHVLDGRTVSTKFWKLFYTITL